MVPASRVTSTLVGFAFKAAASPGTHQPSGLIYSRRAVLSWPSSPSTRIDQRRALTGFELPYTPPRHCTESWTMVAIWPPTNSRRSNGEFRLSECDFAFSYVNLCVAEKIVTSAGQPGVRRPRCNLKMPDGLACTTHHTHQGNPPGVDQLLETQADHGFETKSQTNNVRNPAFSRRSYVGRDRWREGARCGYEFRPGPLKVEGRSAAWHPPPRRFFVPD